jgi:arylsulfatase A-like enzyme
VLRFAPLLLVLVAAAQERHPNILLIVTDDQGYGDLGCHGNPEVKTPNIDALAKNAFQFESFHVSPVCSPTRSSLLTGRYNYRTGVVDTFLGRSMMHADEITLAEMLAAAGYRTGIFGKWHLGDNYPLRAQDQGFQETLTIRGGGIGQPSDPPGGDHYTDATMYRNGKPVKTNGYCTDVLANAAIEFIAANKNRPFFAYVPFNAPHTPLEVPESYLKPYKDAGMPDVTARVYAMVTNIDDNVGRLMKKLDDLQLADDTIVVFMSDNGPQQERYNAGLRGLKGTVFQGGLRVPFLFRWWGLRQPPRPVKEPAAHIDVFPSLLEACGVAPPKGVKIDGRSFLPLLKEPTAPWPERELFFQWHRGDVPEKGRSCAARDSRWKAVWTTAKAKPMLFDLGADPGEKNDVALEHGDVVDRLTRGYELWFEEMRKAREFAPPRIVLDPSQEDPVMLTRQDWRGPRAGWAKDSNGFWLVEVRKDTRYDVTLYFQPPGSPAKVTYTVSGRPTPVMVEADAKSVTLKSVPHGTGPGQLSASIATEKPYGVDYIELRRVD